MKVLIETEKAEIRFNSQTNAIELIWKTYADPASYKALFTNGVEYLKEFGATAWLSDIRNEGVVGPEHSKWLHGEIIPKAISFGLRRIAVVLDSDVFKKFYIKNIETNMTQKGQNLMQYFNSTEEANAWLSLSLMEV